MASSCSQNNSASASVIYEHRYSDQIRNERVLLLGPWPPPFGGIAVHIERVAHKLTAQHNHVIFFDTITRSSLLQYLIQFVRCLYSSSATYLVYHTPYTAYAWVELLLLLFYRWWNDAHLIVVEHDCRYLAGKYWIVKRLLQRVYRYADTFIFMGLPVSRSYQQAGVRIPHAVIESPFLPPLTTAYTAYPSSLHTFIQSHKPLLLTSAYQCIRWEEVDLYGIDQSISMLAAIRQEFAQAGLILVLATTGDHAYYQQLVAQCNEHIYLLVGDYPLWPLFSLVDCFIRPTRNENFGISVAEALYCKVPVIASNVCPRPAGTLVYQVDDRDDLLQKIKQSLQETR